MHEVTAIKDSNELGSTEKEVRDVRNRFRSFKLKINLDASATKKFMTLPDTVDVCNPASPEILQTRRKSWDKLPTSTGAFPPHFAAEPSTVPHLATEFFDGKDATKKG